MTFYEYMQQQTKRNDAVGYVAIEEFREMEMIKQITVLTQENSVSPITVELVNGVGNNLVIHRTPIRADGSDCEYQFTYTITHRPTGYRVIVCRNLLHAKMVKEQLEKLAIDWSLEDVKELKRQEKKTNFSSIYWENDVEWEVQNESD